MHPATELSNARHARPFDDLGLHSRPEGKGLVIRAWFPQAERIEATELKSGKALGVLDRVDAAGLFELHLPRRRKRFSYRLTITLDGHTFTLLDAYQFPERAHEDFFCTSETLYHNMGACLCQATTPEGQAIEGVRFAVYAPNARAVSVIGDFNQWDGRRHPMMSSHDGIWRLFIPDLQPGSAYKFELKNASGDVLPHKQDPYGDWHAQHPSFHSVVWDHEDYTWADQEWQQREVGDRRRQPMSIYELHAGSWRMHEDGTPLNYRELAVQLIPYLQDMGYTHVELMPISEYPFDGSWGYQPVGLFAPSSRFGTPDDFKYFVDQCHQAGIAVIVDWVPAHFPADPHGLAKFDGTALYEYEDPRRGWHPDWNSFIYDYGRTTVTDFLISSAMVWLERYHVDGIRVDAVASMLYLDYSREEGDWVPNVDGGNENYEAIAFVKRFNEAVYGRFPKCFTVAEESTSFPGVSKPTYLGGLGFGFKWNMGWMHDTLEYVRKDPVYRQHHHGELTFSLIYAFDENFVLPLSHDEVVHGKGTILDRMPGDEWQQMANLRTYYAFMYTHPGKKLNFMGNEFGATQEWSHQRPLDWWLLDYPRHRGCQQLVRDLNRLYTTLPALHRLDHEPEGFRWINYDDAGSSVISFCRMDGEGGLVVVVSNFTPMPHEHYRIGVPEGGQYEVILNTDSEYYWGSNFDAGQYLHSLDDPQDGLPCSLELRLPPLGTVILKRN
ncbi:MAG: 1,4-alpha-glucan branching protein GlgB [Natronospirillum sp.]|uniref:1,4-alpha-glucan branching protein GlgB n=1 Tax=Natronospirillum sp. TaxID=2812955 RepID=UPI0025F12D1C|nr:1,4-alpha-glucan branching protein GlgB [Natronospirillum sp.]MCH8551639.1 1,4-alpha-glucan branching protein GlgB [Natronospirillum sp.]